jgi:3-oxoacyl-[acyl-carrier protein] reductase
MVAVVTGGAGGIGSAVCRRLAAEGVRVAVVDREAGSAAAVAADLPADAIAVEADVCDAEQIDRVVAETLARWGRLDVLVTAAGFSRDALVADLDDAAWRAVLDICLYSPFACSRAVAPHMVAAGFGRLVHSSSRAYLGNPGQANYSAAKAGVIGLTRSLSKELGRHGVTANAVAPGFIRTPMTLSHPRYEDIAARAVRESAVRAVGEPEDVAEAVVHLASPRSSFISGDVVHVTGGRFG